jgi:hypothetical protein
MYAATAVATIKIGLCRTGKGKVLPRTGHEGPEGE